MKSKKEKIIKVDNNAVSEGIQFIQSSFEGTKYSTEKLSKIFLLSEELLNQMVSHASQDSKVIITIWRTLGRNIVEIRCKGESIEFSDSTNTISELISDEPEDEIDGAADLDAADIDNTDFFSKMILKVYANDYSLKRVRGVNRATITVKESNVSDSSKVFICMFLGLLAGLLIKLLLDPGVSEFVSENVFGLISNIFLTGIKAVIAPLAFFAIADSFAGISDLSAMGRTGSKVMISYVCTTFAALAIGVMVFNIIQPGDTSMRPVVEALYSSGGTTAAAETAASDGTVTLASIIESFVPNNIVKAFAEPSMLQVIVIAVFIGIASNAIGECNGSMQNFLKTGNALFSKITAYITKLLPITIFCLMGNMVLTIDLSSIGQMAKAFLAVITGILLMMVFYSLLLKFVGKIKVLEFFKSFKDAMLIAFSTCSSSAAIPTTMKCLDDFGVSPKLYSFSIPLGATINMDGGAVANLILALFMTKIYGIQLSPDAFLTLILSTALFVMAAPAVPGAGIAIVTALITQVGIPAGAISFLMPLMALADFLLTTNNVTGDGVVTAIIAKREGMMKEKESR